MTDYLKTYHVALETVGPVFVGSGREITKKEYVLLNQNRRIGVADMGKVYQLVRQKGLASQFDDFILNEQRADLRRWLMEHNISIKDTENSMKYILGNGDTVLERGTKTTIMECIKDPYGNPYIPGSSIKGMLRTILLSAEILKNKNAYARECQEIKHQIEEKKNRNSYVVRGVKQTEARAFRTLRREGVKEPGDAVNDVLSGMIVSDSEPLQISDLVLCQKIERHVDGGEKRLNLLRECIAPGTTICFELTIDSQRCPYTAQSIMDAVAIFAEEYYNHFLSRFSGMDRPYPNTVYLGGGSGFATKTITYPLLGHEAGVDAVIKIFKNTGVPYKHKHERDKYLQVSPHIVKCTHYQGQTLQFGECHISSIG